MAADASPLQVQLVRVDHQSAHVVGGGNVRDGRAHRYPSRPEREVHPIGHVAVGGDLVRVRDRVGQAGTRPRREQVAAHGELARGRHTQQSRTQRSKEVAQRRVERVGVGRVRRREGAGNISGGRTGDRQVRRTRCNPRQAVGQVNALGIRPEAVHEDQAHRVIRAGDVVGGDARDAQRDQREGILRARRGCDGRIHQKVGRGPANHHDRERLVRCGIRGRCRGRIRGRCAPNKGDDVAVQPVGARTPLEHEGPATRAIPIDHDGFVAHGIPRGARDVGHRIGHAGGHHAIGGEGQQCAISKSRNGITPMHLAGTRDRVEAAVDAGIIRGLVRRRVHAHDGPCKVHLLSNDRDLAARRSKQRATIDNRVRVDV